MLPVPLALAEACPDDEAEPAMAPPTPSVRLKNREANTKLFEVVMTYPRAPTWRQAPPG